MDLEIQSILNKYISDFNTSISSYNLKDSIDSTFAFLDVLNKYVDTKEPWSLIKDENKKTEVIDIFYTISE